VRQPPCGEALNFSRRGPLDFFGSFFYQEKNEQSVTRAQKVIYIGNIGVLTNYDLR
jgi:hypothetical protein